VPLHWAQPGMVGAVLAVPVLAALYGVLGAGLGLLLRNTAAALGLALMWAFVIEGILPVLIRAPGVVRWPPKPPPTPCSTAHPPPPPRCPRPRRSPSSPATPLCWPPAAR